MPTFADFPDSEGTPAGDPLRGIGYFLTKMSALDPRIKIDKTVGQGWLGAVGQFDPTLVARAFAAYYSNADLARFTISAAWVRSWCFNALPPRPRCPEHPSYYDGPSCGGCRADRLVAGIEKPVGRSTVPLLEGKPAPMPDYLRKAIEATKRP